MTQRVHKHIYIYVYTCFQHNISTNNFEFLFILNSTDVYIGNYVTDLIKAQEDGVMNESVDDDNTNNNNDDNKNSQKYSWSFDGMNIDFLPNTWEVLITVRNDRLSCEFSSMTGGRLLNIKDKSNRKKKKQSSSSSSDQAINYGIIITTCTAMYTFTLYLSLMNTLHLFQITTT